MKDVNGVDVLDLGRDERVLLREAVRGAQPLVGLFWGELLKFFVLVKLKVDKK